MTFDPQTIVPVANNWLETRIKYEGHCRADFADPKGTIEGKATVCFGAEDDGSVGIEIQTSDAVDGLPFSLDSGTPRPGDYRLHGHSNPCTSLTIRTTDGEFVAGKRILQGSSSIGPNSQQVHLRPLTSSFEVNGAGRAKYWVLPLSNFVLEFWPRQFYAEFSNHPLRIYPTPPIPAGLSEEDQQVANVWANRRNTLVAFLIDGQPGFIEQLPTYARATKRLQRRRFGNEITAVMVGPAHVQSLDVNDFGAMFPIEILSLLTLATGIHVGAPWIEFRDEHGKLVRRNHISFGKPMYDEGHAAIRGFGSNVVGYLLTRAFLSSERSQKHVRAAINHAIAASTKMGSLENRFISVCRGFETLFHPHGVDKEDLSAFLDATQKAGVKTILDVAAADVRALGKTEADPGRKRALQRIADRARSAAGKENDFGLSVLALVRKFGFPDPDILQAYFSANPYPAADNWPGLLSHYRGAAIHGAYFDFPGTHDHFKILRIMDHLHDLLLRIILKTLAYDGPYQPPIPPLVQRNSVEWVTPTTPANILLGCS